MVLRKEVYNNKESNASTIASNGLYIVDVQENAEKSNYLPHNKLRVFNKSDHEVWVYLNGIEDENEPDYILGSGTGLDESVEEGVNYNSVVIKNKGTGTISANEIIVRLATVHEVER